MLKQQIRYDNFINVQLKTTKEIKGTRTVHQAPIQNENAKASPKTNPYNLLQKPDGYLSL